MRGMELLPLSTVFAGDKRQVRASGALSQVGGVLSDLSGVAVEGYEIHMGRTEACQDSCGAAGDGEIALYNVGNVYGTYLHGVFDTAECASALVGALMRAKGLDPSEVQTFDLDDYKQQQYDKLADVMRASLDMDLIYRIVEEGV